MEEMEIPQFHNSQLLLPDSQWVQIVVELSMDVTDPNRSTIHSARSIREFWTNNSVSSEKRPGPD